LPRHNAKRQAAAAGSLLQISAFAKPSPPDQHHFCSHAGTALPPPSHLTPCCASLACCLTLSSSVKRRLGWQKCCLEPSATGHFDVSKKSKEHWARAETALGACFSTEMTHDRAQSNKTETTMTALSCKSSLLSRLLANLFTSKFVSYPHIMMDTAEKRKGKAPWFLNEKSRVLRGRLTLVILAPISTLQSPLLGSNCV